MSSLFKTPEVPEVKAGEGLFDVINTATGLSQTLVKDASGNVTSMNISQELTPAEQKLKDTLEATVQSSMSDMASIQEMSPADYLDNPLVQDYQKYNEALLAKSQGQVSQQQEEILAQRGLSESTTGTESRAALRGQETSQRQQLGLQTLDYANQIRSQQLSEAANAVNVANALQTGSQATAAQSLSGVQNASSLGLQSANMSLQRQTTNLGQVSTGEQLLYAGMGAAAGAYGGGK